MAAAQGADEQAAVFQLKCAACHTVGGGKITDAPDLIVVATWPRADLLAAIKRMEKNVGPLDDISIDSLVDLLLAPDVRQRLAEEQQRRMKELAATVKPGDPRAGRALFLGGERLANDGLPCSSCHSAAGTGGSFAVDLTGVFARQGQAGLMSSIQGANFPVMQAAYRAHPITAQEATNLTEYFKTISSNAETPSNSSAAPIGLIGLGLAATLGVGLTAHRGRAAGTRARLVRRATERSGGSRR